ncbi:MAG: hypothetical protein ACI3YC_09260 [Alloprevotella sp.]
MKDLLTLSEARALRERFFEGDLSQAETRRLARFVCGDACPEEWRSERDFFSLHLAEPSLPAGFAASLEARMKRVEDEEAAAKAVAAPSPRGSLRWRRTAWAVAAGAALALAFAGWHFAQREPQEIPLATTTPAVTSDELRVNHVSTPSAPLARATTPAASPVATMRRKSAKKATAAVPAETAVPANAEPTIALADAAATVGVSEVSDRTPDEVYASTVHNLSEALAAFAEMDSVLRESVESQCVTCLWESLFDAPYQSDEADAAEEPADTTEETGEPTEPRLRTVGDVLQILF